MCISIGLYLFIFIQRFSVQDLDQLILFRSLVGVGEVIGVKIDDFNICFGAKFHRCKICYSLAGAVFFCLLFSDFCKLVLGLFV